MNKRNINLLKILSLNICLMIFGFQSAAAAEKIAFQSNRDGNHEIYVMNADGTNPMRLTHNPLTDESPAFSPDGSKIVYTSNRAGNWEIYVMNANGSHQVNLTNHPAFEGYASFSPDGSKIVFESFRDGNYEIYVMDANGANPTRLTNSPASDYSPRFSPDGSKIVYATNVDGNFEIYAMDANGANPVRLTINAAADYNPIFSPDGSKIAFHSYRDGNYEVYVMDANGANQVNLTNNPAYDSKPSFSPDGSKIAFDSNRDGNIEIYAMNSDGTNQSPLSNHPANDFSASWANQADTDGDGVADFLDNCPSTFNPEKIAFESARNGSDWEIYAMNADGSNPVNLTNNPAMDSLPAFSPDGTKIAFASDRDGNNEIYVMNADGSNQTRLTNNPAVDYEPAFSPDGSKIAFTSWRDGNFEIYIMNADGSNQINLTNFPTGETDPAFSPDGSKIAFMSSRTINFEIFVMNVDGSNPTRLTFNPGDDTNPAFSPDGSKIAFMSRRDGNAQIYVINADGSNQTRLSNTISNDARPAFSPDGSKIVFASDRDLITKVWVMNADGSQPIALTGGVEDWSPTWGAQADSDGDGTGDACELPPDTTPPVITASVSGTLGNNDWFTSNVEVSWSVTDDESAITSQNGCDAQTVSTDTTGITYTCTAESAGGVSSQDVTIKRDATAPTIIYSSRTTPNPAGWNNSSVTVKWSCSDAVSGAISSEVSSVIGTEGMNQEATGSCTDHAGNAASDTQGAINIDLTPPALSPTVTPNPVLLNGTATAAANATDALSGVAAQSCQPVDTSSVGFKSAECSAVDTADNTANASVNYQVIYGFTGFFPPVVNPPSVNTFASGSVVPVKFSLGGNLGLNIFAAGYPASSEIACEATVPGSIIEPAVSPRGAGLSYNATTGQYNYSWKTGKNWKGTCRMFIVRLNDGSEYFAKFRFK